MSDMTIDVLMKREEGFFSPESEEYLTLSPANNSNENYKTNEKLCLIRHVRLLK